MVALHTDLVLSILLLQLLHEALLQRVEAALLVHEGGLDQRSPAPTGGGTLESTEIDAVVLHKLFEVHEEVDLRVQLAWHTLRASSSTHGRSP